MTDTPSSPPATPRPPLLAELGRQCSLEDARARWLGYQDADGYLTAAAGELPRFKRPPARLIRHYWFIFREPR